MLAYFWAGESCFVYIRIPVATMYDVTHRDIVVSRNRGTRKEEDGRGTWERILPSFLPALTFPTLRRFSQYGGYTSRKIRALKENAWECKFWFVLVLSVQPQLPSTGESSYSINMSGGHASIGDHSVTNVGTATPRWRIPNIINWAASSRRQPSS